MNRKLVIALAIYLAALIASNTIGLKLMPFIFGTHLSVAVFYFPIVFLMTDIVGQIYGKRTARNFVLAGFLTTAAFTLFTLLSMATPWSEDGNWVREAYNTVFGISVRIHIASLLAFLIGEYQDVFVFFKLKEKAWAQRFWPRSMMSNIWGQLLDTFIFMFVAFWGIYSFKTIILAGIPWWIYKVLMGAAYSPLAYLGLKWLKKDGQESQPREAVASA